MAEKKKTNSLNQEAARLRREVERGRAEAQLRKILPARLWSRLRW